MVRSPIARCALDRDPGLRDHDGWQLPVAIGTRELDHRPECDVSVRAVVEHVSAAIAAQRPLFETG
jgi:hypothetical protein